MVLFIAVFRDVAVFGDTNLELPSFLSNRSAVEIHLDVDSNIFYQSADINLELPLHARYQVSKNPLWLQTSTCSDYFSQLTNQL